uniref:DM domain-containing protein n=1 Tax=Panagrolaimus sp. PS1159 TaxID=55785 RepID=A0AC35FY18_9BILA
MLKCRKCAAHEIKIPVRGHARTCPYRMCSCDKCVKVVNKRLSSVKRRYKNSDVVFVNIECNSGNVRVQAIPKTLIETLKSNQNCQLASTTPSSSSSNEKPENAKEFSSPPVLEKPQSEPQLSSSPSSIESSPSSLLLNMMQFLPYFRMSPEQQLNLISTYAWILQSAKYMEKI